MGIDMARLHCHPTQRLSAKPLRETISVATRGLPAPSSIRILLRSLSIPFTRILFAASIYMFLGRIAIATGSASLSVIRPTRVTKIFVCGDILCFLVQAMGGATLANTKDNRRIILDKVSF
jgi:hypothetical protein